MGSDPPNPDHMDALRTAAAETRISVRVLQGIVDDARRMSRFRARGIGPAALEAAVDAVGCDRRTE